MVVASQMIFCLLLLPAFDQECHLFIAGTKYDLVEADKKARKVDNADLQDFAEGMLRRSVLCCRVANYGGGGGGRDLYYHL